MSTDFGVNTPVSIALGDSFQDMGGAGSAPANLFAGLERNGVVQEAFTPSAPEPAAPANSFEDMLKPATAPSSPKPLSLG